MKNKIPFLLFFAFLTSVKSYSQKYGTIKNPYPIKFERMKGLPIMVKGQINVPDSLTSRSDMIKSSENLINSIICLFQYMKTKDSNYQIKSRNFYLIGDSLYKKFYSEYHNITIERNYRTMIEGTIEKLGIFTNAKGLFDNDKYGLVYYKLNNIIFGVSPNNGPSIISYFALSQEDLYIVLKSEIKRIENKN